jgi:hypothetical protein
VARSRPGLELCQERADPRPAGIESHDHVRTARRRRPGHCPYPLSHIHRPPARWQAPARPKYCLYLKTAVSPPDSIAAQGQIVICPNGQMYSDSFPLSESESFTSLAGISYPLGS